MQTGQSTETNHVIGVGGGCPGARAGRAPAAPRAEREVARDAPFRGAATSHSRNTIIYIYIYMYLFCLYHCYYYDDYYYYYHYHYIV